MRGRENHAEQEQRDHTVWAHSWLERAGQAGMRTLRRGVIRVSQRDASSTPSPFFASSWALSSFFAFCWAARDRRLKTDMLSSTPSGDIVWPGEVEVAY
jgi:hypothetical protein